MPENKHLRFLLYILYAALALAGFWLVLRFLLPWLAPFLLAFLLAALLERPVKLCMNRLHLPRWGAACLCTVVLWGLACTVVGLLVWRLGYELALMLGRLPTLLAGLPSLASQAGGIRLPLSHLPARAVSAICPGNAGRAAGTGHFPAQPAL